MGGWILTTMEAVLLESQVVRAKGNKESLMAGGRLLGKV